MTAGTLTAVVPVFIVVENNSILLIALINDHKSLFARKSPDTIAMF